jgi:hypothetical protein
MRHSSKPHVTGSQFAWGHLPRDMRDSILEHTATSFVVESCFPICLRFREVGWTEVPYVARYEFKLLARDVDLSTSPEIEFTLTRFLDPAFMQSRLFGESDVSMQEVLVHNFDFKETFSSIAAVRLEMRSENMGFLQLVQRRAHATEHVLNAPFWSRVQRNTIEELREKLKTLFCMELDEQ